MKIGEIAESLDVDIIWNFTEPGHGKGKHDGEGLILIIQIINMHLMGHLHRFQPLIYINMNHFFFKKLQQNVHE